MHQYNLFVAKLRGKLNEGKLRTTTLQEQFVKKRKLCNERIDLGKMHCNQSNEHE